MYPQYGLNCYFPGLNQFEFKDSYVIRFEISRMTDGRPRNSTKLLCILQKMHANKNCEKFTFPFIGFKGESRFLQPPSPDPRPHDSASPNLIFLVGRGSNVGGSGIASLVFLAAG